MVLIGLALSAIPIVGSAILLRRPSAHGTWTELEVVLDGPVHVRGAKARFRGRTALPDGRAVEVRGRRVTLAVAANVAATGQLWLAGPPRPGKPTAVGLPGHAVYGSVRLG
ncbi:hypothetical protein [Amycolatopsis sp. PS_44_ISF1]|uniref:hypothetical protein n=1 Tax=Amycolatopsis sp. PS_44_ISF1 TaxID=2974917 RepID=UPI0028DDEEAA|nr:hypothetical protein [Amycolatopsis sp. PS_44_ISF1]MDT8910327.1 hypothetical protein [Amycolatopsis sp. PS_44_ISF1]